MKIIVVYECPDCGAWLDVPYASLQRIRNGTRRTWRCTGCGRRDCRTTIDVVRVAALEPTDGRLYDLLLEGFPCLEWEYGYRYPEKDVRPVLEPLL